MEVDSETNGPLASLDRISLVHPRRVTKIRIVKNLLVISIGFLLLFTAYNGLSMLQSTMNQDHGIGVVSQGIIYAGFCLSALLLPKYTIKKLGCKNTILLSMGMYIPYVASNFYPQWITMVPSAISVGLAASLLWSAQCAYFNESSVLYSDLIVPSTSRLNLENSHVSSSHASLEKNESRNNESSKSNNRDISKIRPEDKRIFSSLESYRLPNDKTSSTEYPRSILNPCELQHINTAGSSSVTYMNNENVKEYKDENKLPNEHNHTSNSSTRSYELHSKCDSLFDMKTIRPNTQLPEQLESKIETKKRAEVIESTTARSFGFFGLAYHTTNIWSNLMSYYVLQNGSTFDNIAGNASCACGAAFCNEYSTCFQNNLAEPSHETRILLTAISVAVGLSSLLVVFLFLDQLGTDKEPITFSFHHLMATLRFAKKKKLILLMPLSLYTGMSFAFYIGDFTKSFIGCSWGEYHIGLVSLCFGTISALSSMIAGWLVKHFGRLSIILTAGLVSTATNIFLLFWDTNPNHPSLFFLTAGAYGFFSSVFWSQFRAFYGILFKKDEETAFATFYLWEALGCTLSFSYSNYICTYVKLYILLAVSFLGLLGYLRVEIIHRNG